MADRRVERRDFQVGTGMMNDPERLEELEMRQRQSDLNARLPPKTTFKQVLTAAPKIKSRAKRSRPRSSETLRPSAAAPTAAPVAAGFATSDDDLGETKPKIIVRV